MSCCQANVLADAFDDKTAKRDLRKYRRKGPSKSTRALIDALRELGAQGKTLLDIGGGIGAIQHELFKAGISTATHVDASGAYLSASKQFAEEAKTAGRTTYVDGDFVENADQIPVHDIVALDRVICCFPDMPKLVGLSAERTGDLYGLVYPRDIWWAKLIFRIGNSWFWLTRDDFRAFVHPTSEVEKILARMQFVKRVQRHFWFWQVVVFQKAGST